MEKFLLVAEVTKPQGIKGELKLKTYVDDLKRFYKLKTVYVDDKPVKVLSARVSGEDVYISLNGIGDRNIAELYRGKKLFVAREDAVELKKGQYFIVDVIGSKVVLDDGKTVGKVLEITKYNTDVYSCTDGKANFMFPLVDGLLDEIDVENKVVKLNAKRFYEVVCYED